MDLAQQEPLASESQRRIHDLLTRLIGVGAAEFFHDAMRIASNKERFATASHLVGHLLREMESNVREVLATLPGAQEQLKQSGGKGEQHRRQIEAILAGTRPGRG